MLYKIGRFLQVMGLFFIVPIGLAGGVLERLDLRTELMVCGTGGLVFFVGWMIQQTSKK